MVAATNRCGARGPCGRRVAGRRDRWRLSGRIDGLIGLSLSLSLSLSLAPRSPSFIVAVFVVVVFVSISFRRRRPDTPDASTRRFSFRVRPVGDASTTWFSVSSSAQTGLVRRARAVNKTFHGPRTNERHRDTERQRDRETEREGQRNVERL